MFIIITLYYVCYYCLSTLCRMLAKKSIAKSIAKI